MHTFTQTAQIQSSNVRQALHDAKRDNLSWDDFVHRGLVRENLLSMQENRCAYCERAVTAQNGHIEHFRKRSPHIQYTFVWGNLFYSCMDKQTCGKWKDKHVKPSLDYYAKLLNPREDNIEKFLVFTAIGDVAVRDDCSEEDKERAAETIRVFHLNAPHLARKRREILEGWKWLRAFPEQIDETLTGTEIKEFVTAIYHLVGRRVVPQSCTAT
jgi:TIGR02646 family protein